MSSQGLVPLLDGDEMLSSRGFSFSYYRQHVKISVSIEERFFFPVESIAGYLNACLSGFQSRKR
jgi:hypothetical protein